MKSELILWKSGNPSCPTQRERREGKKGRLVLLQAEIKTPIKINPVGRIVEQLHASEGPEEGQGHAQVSNDLP